MKIVLVNAHWNNRGDEAALCALIDSLYTISENIELFVIFKEVKSVKDISLNALCTATRYRPTEDQVLQAIMMGKCNNKEMIKETEIIKDADLIIYAPGGAVISDRFWWEKQLEYIFPLAYAQTIGKKLVFASLSIGPFSENHILRNNILSRVNNICLRESISKRHLEESLGKNDHTILSNDLAFLGKIDMEKERRKVQKDNELSDFLKYYNIVIGITITDLMWNVGYLNDNYISERIYCSFKEFVRWLDRKRIGVVLIPQLFGEQNDEIYLNGYKEENTFILSSRYNSSFQQYLISKLYAVIGLRYHSNVFAAKMGTPMIPIVYEQKMRGFLEDSKIESWGIDVKDISFEVLKNSFEKLREEYSQRKDILKKMHDEWIRRSRITIDVITEYIDLYNT